MLVRAGQTEAGVDLARMAGLNPAGVICEIMNEDGTMARVPQLQEFCGKHGLKMISVADLIRYRMQHERFIRRVAEGCIETEFGEFRTVAYSSQVNPEMHVALVRGDVAGKEGVLVRMHARCVYGDVFGSVQCDCHKLMRGSLARIADEDLGVLVYLHETGPGFRDAEGRYRRRAHGHALARVHALRRCCGAAAASVRKRHRRADSVRPRTAHHPAADQPPAQNRGPRRVRHRSRGTGAPTPLIW